MDIILVGVSARRKNIIVGSLIDKVRSETDVCNIQGIPAWIQNMCEWIDPLFFVRQISQKKIFERMSYFELMEKICEYFYLNIFNEFTLSKKLNSVLNFEN